MIETSAQSVAISPDAWPPVPKMPDGMGAFVDSMPIVNDGDALRDRATADGYLFFKGLLPHCELTWDDIYSDWQADDLKFYRQALSLTISGWDESLHQPRRRIC